MSVFIARFCCVRIIGTVTVKNMSIEREREGERESESESERES